MYTDRVEHLAALYLRADGALCIGNQTKPLAGLHTPSVQQFNVLKDDLLRNEGIIRYRDAFQYAEIVLPKFISILEECGLHDVNGVYKAVGAVKKQDLAGIKIGSYWEGFNGVKQHDKYKYWGIVDEICTQLQYGKLYRAESLICKLICRLFHYAGINSTKTGKEHTPSSLRLTLKERYNDIYAEHVLRLTQLADYTRTSVSQAIRSLSDTLLISTLPPGESIFDLVPAHFMEELEEVQKDSGDKNVFIDPIRGRRIQFDTVHGVKGETHDATLYLETEKNRGSDIGRVLCYYGIGQPGTSPLYDYSRKIVYVGMSRPRKLLCVAIQESTYAKSKNTFQIWDKIDLREVDDR